MLRLSFDLDRYLTGATASEPKAPLLWRYALSRSNSSR